MSSAPSWHVVSAHVGLQAFRPLAICEPPPPRSARSATVIGAPVSGAFDHSGVRSSGPVAIGSRPRLTAFKLAAQSWAPTRRPPTVRLLPYVDSWPTTSRRLLPANYLPPIDGRRLAAFWPSAAC